MVEMSGRIADSFSHPRVFGNKEYFMKKDKNRSNLGPRDGYIALITVIVVGAVGVAVGVSLLLLGLSSSRTGFAVEQSAKARSLANACAENALQLIHDSVPYTGTANLSLDDGTCSSTVTAGVGQNRTIVVTGTVGTVIRKINISVTQITPTISVSSWLEIP